jgi:hypothetical protein
LSHLLPIYPPYRVLLLSLIIPSPDFLNIDTIIRACPERSAYKGHRDYELNILSLERALNNCYNPAEVQIQDLTDIVHSLRMLSVHVKGFSDYALVAGSRNPGQVVSLKFDGSDEWVEATYEELHENYISDFLGK